MSKQFLAVIAVIILGFFGVLVISKKKDNSTNNQAPGQQTQTSNHVTGAGADKVKLVEFGDFQCPACKQYYPLVKQIKEKYAQQITFQFRHFPLTQIHPNAFIGSRAAEAAGLQGKFFEMYDMLYENQENWSTSSNPTPILEDYAKQLGLNIDKFKSDMNSSAVASVINADLKAGQQLGVNSTPTFFINDKKIEKNPTSIDEFSKLIDEAIAQQKKQ